MIAPSNYKLAVELIQEANRDGARLARVCTELNISVRKYESCVSNGYVKEDQCPYALRPEAKNKKGKKY